MSKIESKTEFSTNLSNQSIEDKFERIFSKFLQICIGISGILIFLGMILSILEEITFNMNDFSNELILENMISFSPIGLIFLGIFILIFSPVVRVILTIFLYIYLKDRKMGIISIFVFVFMMTGIFFGTG